jgi:hypothetical protein
VWNTCLVFFQAVLLFGYLYSHISTHRLGIRRQAALHLGVLALPVLLLPIAVDAARIPDTEAPAWWLLGTLFIVVGLPFFVVSTTGPLLQKWFASTGHPSASDPYYLYIASNLGSLLALVAYPVAIESWLSLSQQAALWQWIYFVFIGMCILCAIAVFACRGEGDSSSKEADTPVKPKTALRWVGLAFIPSSLLMGVTTHLTTDLAPVPLLWVVPLALYLLSFIIAFSKSIRLPLKWIGRLLAMSVIASTLVILIGATEPITAIIAVHLITLFLAALLCHGILASERPPTQQLTAFYLWLSVGGVLGGIFNTLLAPLLFHKLGLIEYPLMLVVVSALGGARKSGPHAAVPYGGPHAPREENLHAEREDHSDWRPRFTDFLYPSVLGILLSLLVISAQDRQELISWFQALAKTSGLDLHIVRNAILFGVPAVLVYTFVDRPLRFALGIAALFLAANFDPGPMGKTIFLERDYLGVIRVTISPDGKFRRMIHGNTIHGQQRIMPKPRFVASCLQTLGASNPVQLAGIVRAAEDTWSRPNEPLTYYSPTGPAGQVFRTLVRPSDRFKKIGVIGLGIGALTAYARPDQDWTFFELDPAVIRLAQNTEHFTFLRDYRPKSLEIIAGDARLQLARLPDQSFDVLVLDAFSSDAIPIHLLTTEAMALYERKLAPGGLLLFHVSNRYLDLPPILGKLAQSCEPALVAKVNDDRGVSDDQRQQGREPSIWVLIAREPKELAPLMRGAWLPVRVPHGTPLWSDDRANVLGAFRRSSEE